MVIAQHSDTYRKIGDIEPQLVYSEILDCQSCLSRICIAVRVNALRLMMSGEL